MGMTFKMVYDTSIKQMSRNSPCGVKGLGSVRQCCTSPTLSLEAVVLSLF